MFTTGAADQGEEEQAGYLGLHRGVFSRFTCHQDEPSICGCQGRSISAVSSAAQNQQGIKESIASNKTAIFIATTLLKTKFFVSAEVT